MFTGIVTDVGRVVRIDQLEVGQRLMIATSYDTSDIVLGASIACNGACLTVVEKTPGHFGADVSGETLDKTTIGTWAVDAKINLERSLKAADELGGHLVLGHVDAVGSVVRLAAEGENYRVDIEVPDSLKHYVASKGSITVDGVSLTVNEVDDRVFGVNLIPHTWDHTSFVDLILGAKVNLEVDVIARYVARLLERK
ncbi:MAG: riboflavin synthase [Alphaproteobacteria bacterium]|jgi:riboflavin synthase|nr:riboflavin synthase [Alphaproteobacteria bacterium]